MMNVKETAKQIRKELKEKFPFTKFSVRCERSGSINVSWTDFPTEKAVEEVVSKYEQVQRCEVTGEILGGGNLFIFTRQKWSEEIKKKIETEVRNNYGESYLSDRACYYRAFNETAEKMYQEFLETLESQKEASKKTKKAQQEQYTDVKTTYTINEELNGIEITFTGVPSEEVRNELKANGFRWSKYKKVWYAKQSEERLQFAKMLAGGMEEKQTETVTEQSETQQKLTQTKEIEQESINSNNSTQEKEQGRKIFTVIPEVQENTFDLQLFNESINTDDIILNLFDTIDLTQEKTLISDEDREHINKLEESYRATLSVFKNTLQQLKALYKQFEDDNKTYNSYSFVCQYNDIKNMEERISKLKNNFISRVCYYFINKYNVTIDYELICKKYDTTVTAQNILDEIIEQLDGFSFIEKAQQEIKQQLQKETTYSKPNIKGNKLTLSNFFYFDKFDLKWGSYKLSYNSYEKAQILLKALYLYEYNITQLTEEAEELYKTFRYGKNDNVFTIHELNMKKVKSIKLYKNGRVDIEFTSNYYAKEFAKDFLNIVKAA